MTATYRLWFGPLAALILLVGVVGLAFAVPGYNSVHQTVSEIGEMDSPMRGPFAAMLCAVALCVLVFGWAVYDLSRAAGNSRWSAYLIAFMAVPAAGTGIFAFPHPLHNVFGVAEIIGYQAPLAMALAWRADPRAKRIVTFSWVMFALVWITLLMNFSTFMRGSELWTHIRPYYGVIQRSLFATWYFWCAGLGLLLRNYTAGQPALGVTVH